MVYLYTRFKMLKMARQSITFTEKNNKWLKAQVDSDEYTSKSELINSLIRQARGQEIKIDWIRTKLIKAEESGYTNRTKEEILARSKQMLNNK